MLLPMASMAAVGAGLTIIGVGVGIGLTFLGGLQAMARQPEMMNKFQTTMIIGVAFIEGMALFALVMCLMKG